MFCCMTVEHVLLHCCLILTAAVWSGYWVCHLLSFGFAMAGLEALMARCGFSQDWFSAFSGPSCVVGAT